MKIQRTLAWSMAGLALVLAVAGCVCTKKALPDVEPTPVGGAQDVPMGENAQNTAMAGTAHARETLTAQPGDMAGDTPSSPEATPTEAPPTAVPPTAIPPTAVPPTSAPAPTTAPSTGGTVTYIVQRGDTLYSIARRYGTTVEAIASANGITNPNLIRVGQKLTIPTSGSPVPPPSGGTTYVVQPGDNLFRIALRYNMSYLYLASYNGISDPSRIYVGQVLRIP
ncbi:MAG: LysM peptidoglycan-binding domain-containing protein [Anaerolineae bacterium]|nr:LysM peptidoglycan-binding domain-containing protein [Anaerolineae bacterium]